MKSLKNLSLVLLAMLALYACGDDDDDFTGDDISNYSQRNDNANPSVRPEYLRLEFPRIKGDDNNLVLIHKSNLDGEFDVNYSVEWDCTKKSQRWSCYMMTKDNIKQNTSRYYSTDNQYPQDPDLPSAFRFDGDPFWGSGFDHGHICPSADRLCSADANYQTFFLTNMQPQKNKFNAGIWAQMEDKLRSWVNNGFCDTLYVCKGGTIDDSSKILATLSQGLIVPKYFYMAVLGKNARGYKAMAFWAEHLDENRSKDNLKEYMHSVDWLEQETGIDFFCNLPDELESRVESDLFTPAWGYK